jgi:hypothetical protein
MAKIINSFKQQKKRQKKNGHIEPFFKRKKFEKYISKTVFEEPSLKEFLKKPN